MNRLRPIFRFYVRAAIITGMVLLAIVTLYIVVPPSRGKYVAATADKYELMRAAEHPAMFLVGGSNLAFSVNSGMIEEALGYDVVNTAINVNFGLQFILRMALDELRPGDVIVLSLEHELLDGQVIAGRALPEVLAVFPRGWKYAPLRHVNVREFVLGVQHRVSETISPMLREPMIDPIYDRNGFDENGDLTTHLNPPFEPEPFGLPTVARYSRTITPYARGLLNEFHERALAEGATVLMSFPPWPEELVDHDPQAWLADLRSATSIPIISNPETFHLPRSYFFDSEYHLGAKGRAIYTQRMIEDLETALRAGDMSHRQVEVGSPAVN